MEETPEIIMQCPKCAKEFSPDTCYCETCSAMLEPVEIAARQSDAILQDSYGTVFLKSDIDETFAQTLLLELQELRKRLSAGAHPLAGSENAGIKSGLSESSPADKIIGKRIAQLEAIFVTLERKIQSDIAELEARLGSLKTRGLFFFLTSEGRMRWRLTSELKGKYATLNSIQGKQPPPSMGRFFGRAAAVIAAVILAAASWTFLPLSTKKETIPVTPSATLSTNINAVKDINIKDVINLLEDIKKANLNKDMSLWEARYSKNYPALRKKKENIRKLWQNFDYTSLEYRIDGMNVRPAAASALITWDIELRAKKTGEVIRSSEPLSADFIREDKTLKISAIRKKGR